MFAQYLQALHADAEGSAAQQQPTQVSAPGTSSASTQQQQQVPQQPRAAMDFDSDSAFPALGAGSGKGKGSTAPRAPQATGWASATSRPTAAGLGAASAAASADGAAAAVGAPNSSYTSTPAAAAANGPPPTTGFRDHVSLPTAEIHLTPAAVVSQMQRKRNEDLPPSTLGEAAAMTMKHHSSVKVEASTSKNAATFHFAGPTEAAVHKAKTDLLARIVKKVSIVVQVPGSTRPFIIGQKGRTLKAIQDESGAHVQLPPKETAADEAAIPIEDSDDVQEPIFPVTVTGTQYSCDLARSRIEAIVAERASKIVHTAKVPASQFEASVWPFVRTEVEPEWQADLVDVTYSPTQGLEVKGDSKDKCQKWAQTLVEKHAAVKSTLKSASINIAKRQHRFLRDPAAMARIHEQTGFVIELPPLDSPEERVIIRGRAGDAQGRMQAMGAVVELAESGEISTVDLAQYFRGQQALQTACRYFNRKPQLLNAGLESGVSVDLPTRAQVASGHAELEVVAASADALRTALDHLQQTCQLLGQPDRLASVEVDTLHHKHLLPGGSKAKQLRSLQDKYSSADIIFPKDGASSGVLVAFPDASSEPALAELQADLKSIISELGHVDSVSLDVPQNLHDAVRGPNNTTLNVLIGEQRATAISFGPGDKVTVRGAKSELQRVKRDIEALVKRAQTEDIATVHEASFDLEARFVGYIVGKSGAGVNKLNSELGVRVQFDDVEAPASGDATVVKKKSSKPRVHVTIRGRRENVDEAKNRIIAHAERVADETTASISLPANVDRRILIGKQGTYVQRLESKYEVRVLFPKAEDSDSAITIRGPRKGVEGAKKELNELIEYELENSHSTTFKVPVKAVPRIVGRGGAQVNDIMAETGASVDVESPDGSQTEVTVTLRGNKDGVAGAKKLIQKIAQEAQDETVINMTVAKSLQAGLIGRGGSNLKEMITRCGGPADARSQGAMVRLPRPGDAVSDQITLRGKRSVVEKLQKEIEAYLAREKSRVLYGVIIPKSSHASIIGRGGVGINDLSTKHNVRILFPNWKENSVGAGDELVNAAEVQDAEPESLIRIVGLESDCKAAAEEMLSKQASTPARGSRSATPQASVSRTVEVPAHLHRVIADGGRFFRRNIPSRVNVDHAGATLPPSLPKPKVNSSADGAGARIDMDEEDAPTSGGSILESWDVVPLFSAEPQESSTIPWVISGQNEENVAKAEAAVQAAVERVKDWTHIAYAKVGRANMPRVIGKGGAGLENLRAVSRGEVEALGRRDADTISITASEDGLLAAKAELERLEQR